MINEKSFDETSGTVSLMRSYCSFSIFLFSAISLILPSGFTYGVLLLLLSSFFLPLKKIYVPLAKSDWCLIGMLLLYFIVNAFLSFFHGLSASSYDKSSRYLLAIPIYFLLINYPSRQEFFWYGLIVGTFGAFGLAIYQQYYSDLIILSGRSTGFLNAIQFGDISVLMAGLSLAGILYHNNRKYKVYLFVFSSLMGLSASFLSSSRGGWLAIPLILSVFYVGSISSIKKRIFLSVMLILGLGVLVVIVLPEDHTLKNRIAVTKYEISAYLQVGAGEYTSVSTRVMMWKSGIDAFKSRPFLGWGNLESIISNFSLQWENLKTLDNFNHLHNEYIDALAKKGLVGFTALMAMYLVPLYYFVGLMRTRQADVMPFAAAGVVLILCVMVFGLTQCFLAHNSGTMVFVFYLVIIKAYCRNIVAARMPVVQA